MSTEHQDPMDFLRHMWGGMGVSLPGMVTPTFDLDEIEKRITDLKAVEGWLRMNLSMLQMTIQGLEMQKATLTAVHAMGKMAETPSSASPHDGPTVGETLSQAALWPWNLMQQMQEQLQQGSNEAPSAPDSTPKPTKGPAPRKPKKDAG